MSAAPLPPLAFTDNGFAASSTGPQRQGDNILTFGAGPLDFVNTLARKNPLMLMAMVAAVVVGVVAIFSGRR